MTSSKPGRRRTTRMQLEAHIVTSGLHRVVHADGIWGGLTPAGQIRMGVYNDSGENPNSVLYDVRGGKQIEVSRNPKAVPGLNHVTRLMEVDIVMSLGVAESLHVWLGEKIWHLKEALSQISTSDTEDEENAT